MLQSSAPVVHLSFITDKYEGTGKLRHHPSLAWPGLAMLTSVVVVVVTGLAWGHPAAGISETDTLLKISPSLII